MSEAQWSHPRFLFASGCPEDNRAWFIAQDGDTFRMIQLKDEKWVQRALPWDAVALCGTLVPALQLFIIGVDGEVLHISPAGMANERIQAPQSDPARVGMLRSARYIDGLPHVVGMGPQAYRREVDGHWTSLAHTLRPESKGTKQVKGFHAIDGFSQDHLLAVGHAGEIWRSLAGQWMQLDSPTNVTLNAVHCLPDGTAWICGQAGTLLRVSGDAVDLFTEGGIKANLYGLVWFKGSIYVASQSQIFKLDDRELVEITPQIGDGITTGELTVFGDTLWSVGAHHILTSKDGVTWALQVCPL